MDPFYMYVSIGALVVFILILIVVGVALTQLQSLDSFPPTQNTCPDYWDVSSNPAYCGVPVNSTMRNLGYIDSDGTGVKKESDRNIGMCTASGGFGCNTNGDLLNLSSGLSENGKFQYVKLNDNSNWSTMYPGMSEKCAQRNWAQTLNISWDGVTNYNGC